MGRVAAVLSRRGKLGPNAFVFGTENGEYVGSFKTAWESLLLIANGPRDEAREAWRSRRSRQAPRDRSALARLASRGRLPPPTGRWRRHPIIQLMLGHASVQQTQRYLNVTDEELRKGLEVSWKRRTLKAVAGGNNA
jgi:integrase